MSTLQKKRLTRIKIYGAHKRNMHTKSSMRSTTFETTKGTNRQRPFGSTRRRYNQRGPPRLPFRTITANLILRKTHENLEALLENFLIGHDDADAVAISNVSLHVKNCLSFNGKSSLIDVKKHPVGWLFEILRKDFASRRAKGTILLPVRTKDQAQHATTIVR